MTPKPMILVALALLAVPAFAQKPTSPTVTRTIQMPAATTEIQSWFVKSIRMSCVSNEMAGLRIVSSTDTYEVSYSCFPFTCASDKKTCRATCSDNAQCAGGTVCSSSQCVIPIARCNADFTESVSPLGSDKCFPYNCNKASGACQRDCRTTEDCTSSFVCEISSHTCVHP